MSAQPTRSSRCPGNLRPQLHLLHIATLSQASDRLAEAFAHDTATQVTLQQATSATAGAARLRDEPFDAVLISHNSETTDQGETLDAIELVAALRSGGVDTPLLILGQPSAQELEAVAYEAGADGYCQATQTTVRSLLWKLSRTLDQRDLARENHRYARSEKRRLQQEHQESQHLLEQQRALIADLEELGTGVPTPAPLQVIGDSLVKAAAGTADPMLHLPETLTTEYRELLRAYVIMGTGNLGGQLAQFSDLLGKYRTTAHQMMQLHVEVLEDLVAELGTRSARHVMNRADLLAIEVLGHLADSYRQRYHGNLPPSEQQGRPRDWSAHSTTDHEPTLAKAA